MQKRGMRESGGVSTSLLLAFLCPIRQPRGRKYFVRKSDSKIYICGAWRSISATLSRRIAHRAKARTRPPQKRTEEAKARDRIRRSVYYHNHKKRLNRERCERARKNQDAENSRHRDWYSRNRTVAARREQERRARRDPLKGLKGAIYRCSRGEIDVDELDRLISDRIKRIDERGREKRDQNRAHQPSASGVGLQRRKANVRAPETEARHHKRSPKGCLSEAALPPPSSVEPADQP